MGEPTGAMHIAVPLSAKRKQGAKTWGGSGEASFFYFSFPAGFRGGHLHCRFIDCVLAPTRFPRRPQTNKLKKSQKNREIHITKSVFKNYSVVPIVDSNRIVVRIITSEISWLMKVLQKKKVKLYYYSI